MRTVVVRIAAIAFVVMALDLAPASAQFNPIQAAKDAYNKAKAQQQQQQQQQQSQQQPAAPATPTNEVASAQPAGSPPNAAPQPAAAPAPAIDCCSADAQKKLAASAGFLDIVGIKLGMTPEQAVAAIKAFNPAYKIEPISARLEHPSQPGTFVRVPEKIQAHTANMDTNKGQVDAIVIYLTGPPNPPVVKKVTRYLGFPVGKPVTAGNLVDALRKKYGQETTAAGSGANVVWIYDSTNKLITHPLTYDDTMCTPISGGGPGIQDPTSDGTGVSLDLLTQLQTNGAGYTPGCAGSSFVSASNVGESFLPNSPQIQMSVTIQSGSLMYFDVKSEHDWLQAELDAKNKQLNDANKNRAAPTF
jgi:hypothetical protein